MSWWEAIAYGVGMLWVGYAVGLWVGAGQGRHRLASAEGLNASKDELIAALTEGRDAWKGVAEGRLKLIRELRKEPNFCSNCGERYDCEECAETEQETR